MLKKISSKLMFVFTIMFISVASTTITSYLAVDTQEQHLMLTELLSRQKLLIEKVILKTINIAEISELGQKRFDEKLGKEEPELKAYIVEVDKLFDDSRKRRYTFRGDKIKLKFRAEFAELFDEVVEKAISEWEKSKVIMDYLNNPENIGDRKEYQAMLEKFEDNKSKLIMESDMIVTICMEESKTKQKISNFIQVSSLIFSSVLFFMLIILITKNFYEPFIDIKRIFIKMSKGEIKSRFKREQEDEFKELYEQFNYFLDSINEIFKLEDKILLENSLDNVLLYLKNNFRNFLPFTSLEITYRNSDKELILKRISGDKIERIDGVLEDLEVYNSAKILGKNIIAPIKVNNVSFGTIKFGFEDEKEIHKSYINFLELIQNKLSLTFYKNFLFKDLLSIVTDSLSKMAEAKDPETGLHIIRMSIYSQLIAKKLKENGLFLEEIDSEFIENIKICAPMHDIGKVSIPDRVLLKPGKLDDDEWKVMKSHAGAGGLILEKLHKKFKVYHIDYFKMASDIAYGHHEKWDGGGYPRSLKGEKIPLSARIIAVGDVFDALTSKRPYKDAFSIEKSYKIVMEGSGTHFDSRIVEAFVEIRGEVEKVYNEFREK